MKPTRRDREKRPFSSGHTECAWETLVYPRRYVTPYLYQHDIKHAGEVACSRMQYCIAGSFSVCESEPDAANVRDGCLNS